MNEENKSNFESLMEDIKKSRSKYRLSMIAAIVVLIALPMGIAGIVSTLTPFDLIQSWMYWFFVNAIYLHSACFTARDYLLLKEKVKDAID